MVDYTKYYVILGILLLVIIIIFSILIYRITTMNSDNDDFDVDEPIYEKEGTVIDKRESVSNYQSALGAYGRAKIKINYTYFIMFEFKDGSRRELKTPHEMYGQIIVGDKGLIEYGDDKLISFNRYI